jgi:hypothetical protein
LQADKKPAAEPPAGFNLQMVISKGKRTPIRRNAAPKMPGRKK